MDHDALDPGMLIDIDDLSDANIINSLSLSLSNLHQKNIFVDVRDKVVKMEFFAISATYGD